VLVDSSPSAASGQLPINHDGRHTADAVLRRAGCHIVLVHVMNVNIVLWARQLPHLLDSVLTGRATRAENLNLVLHSCTLSLLHSFVWNCLLLEGSQRMR